MNSLTGLIIALILLFLLSLAALVYVVPAWLDERRQRKATEAATERLRQRVREVRAEADAAKSALARCEAAALQATAAARKAGDSVALANELIAEATRASTK